jgi:hypothetical protein
MQRTLFVRVGKVVLAIATLLVVVLGVKRFVYFDTIIPEVYPCLLHGWTENSDAGRKVVQFGVFLFSKIWDTFPFSGELDVLEARLHELDEVIDHFVIVESSQTYRGHDKPLYFEENKERFSAFLHKIVHVKLPEAEPPSFLVSKSYLSYRFRAKKENIFGENSNRKPASWKA